jgi:hypothetical protein
MRCAHQSSEELKATVPIHKLRCQVLHGHLGMVRRMRQTRTTHLPPSHCLGESSREPVMQAAIEVPKPS